MEDKAQAIVHNYIMNHLDKSDGVPKFEVYTVWKCKALQNWKFLISSSLLDGMYYELTFNGDKGEWYLDAYKKFENQVIQEDTSDTPQTEYDSSIQAFGELLFNRDKQDEFIRGCEALGIKAD